MRPHLSSSSDHYPFSHYISHCLSHYPFSKYLQRISNSQTYFLGCNLIITWDAARFLIYPAVTIILFSHDFSHYTFVKYFQIISKIFQKYLSHIFLRMQSDHYLGCGPIYPAAATIIPFHIIFHIVFHTILFQNIFKEFLILKHISWDAI